MFTNSPAAVIVFSHVDGVLADPHTPRFARAAAVLRALRGDNAALVLCSGKTRAELGLVQHALDIRHPFVSENGGAVYIPENYFDFDVPDAHRLTGYQVVQFGLPYADVVSRLHEVADRLRIPVVGFSDMSIDEVARECGLPLLQARLAKLREHDEPFRMPGATAATRLRLLKGLRSAGLICRAGSSFDSAGAPVDIALGINTLITLYRRRDRTVTTVGLAHTTTDETLLRLVDHRIIVLGDDRPGGSIDVVEWAEAIVTAVQEIGRRAEPSADRERSRQSMVRLH
jgi:mannosyl-3-phosphoglycerate phosphatase